MHLGPELVYALAALRRSPVGRRSRLRAERIRLERDGRKVLQKADEDEGHLVVRKLGFISLRKDRTSVGSRFIYLLPETNARAGVESAGYVRCLERGGRGD